jgi:hypothetical protein
LTPERLAKRQDAAEEIGRRANIALSSERDLGTNAIYQVSWRTASLNRVSRMAQLRHEGLCHARHAGGLCRE